MSKMVFDVAVFILKTFHFLVRTFSFDLITFTVHDKIFCYENHEVNMKRLFLNNVCVNHFDYSG